MGAPVVLECTLSHEPSEVTCGVAAVVGSLGKGEQVISQRLCQLVGGILETGSDLWSVALEGRGTGSPTLDEAM
jgi:hypothetical protein